MATSGFFAGLHGVHHCAQPISHLGADPSARVVELASLLARLSVCGRHPAYD
jgi:hypothetical protein